MATRSEKLAQSLEALKALCEDGRTAIRSRDLTRTHRVRLLEAGYLMEALKGWYICTNPEQGVGESASWYISYWGFCADYLNEKLGEDWCLSPEQSLLLHAGNRTIPHQLIVRSGKASNSVVSLPCGTTLLPVRAAIPAEAEREALDGLHVYSIAKALNSVSPDFFRNHATEARATLARMGSASEILPPLLEKGQTTIAGRLAGAFRNIKRTRTAEDIVKAMKAAGHDIRISDPFAGEVGTALPTSPPHVTRLRLMWASMREDVIAHFPEAPDRRVDAASYMRAVEEAYVTDAYHSLSIEGYRVSRDLIERVRSRDWAPDANEGDRNARDAMAAKGYWSAFQQVKKSLKRVLDSENPGLVAEEDHGDWYRALFAPSVAAGIVKAADLAGYRNGPVFIRGSRHVPPRSEAVRDLMPAFFELLAEESNAGVRAVLGHFVFVNIHPYMDGNGRIGRFLMNLMLGAGGWPWVVVPMERREGYMGGLERASVMGEITPFAGFIAGLVAGRHSS